MPISKVIVTKERLREYLLKIIGELIQIKEKTDGPIDEDTKELLMEREIRLDSAREDIFNALSLSGRKKEMLKEETLELLREMYLYEYKFKKLYRTMFGRVPRTTKEIMDDMTKAKSPAEKAILQDYLDKFDEELKAKLKRENKLQREQKDPDSTHKDISDVGPVIQVEPSKIEIKKPIGPIIIKKKKQTETPEQERERKVKERLEYESTLSEIETEEGEDGLNQKAKENACLLQKLAHIASELDRRELYAEADKIDKIIERFNLV